MVVGVTGPYAAGKDEVTGILVRLGFEEINVDRIGHRVLGEKKAELVSAFGERVLGPGGEVDRRSISAVVFSDQHALARLEAIVHPRMKELVAETIARSGSDCVVNAALLFPMGLAGLTDAVIAVNAPFLARACRARKRDRLAWREVLARFRAQKKIIPQQLPPGVDIYYVWNTRNRTYLTRQVETIVRDRLRKEKRDERR